MNNVLKRLSTVLISLFLLAYVAFQAYLSIYHPVKTMRVNSQTVDDSIRTDAFMLHNEILIKQAASAGVIDYTRQDGECVSSGGVVAQIYKSAQDAEDQREIQVLNSQISQYQQIGNAADASSIDITALGNETEKQFQKLSADASGGNVEGLGDDENSLLALLNEKQMATGEVKNLDAKVSQLTSQKAKLTASAGAALGQIASPAAGYFVSGSDGYENLFDTNKISSITPDTISALLTTDRTPQAGVAGRIISDSNWYIVCNLPANSAHKLHLGDSVNIDFLLSSSGSIPVTVAQINSSAKGYAVVFQCSYMTSGLAAMRRQTIDIVTNTYTGIKIPNQYIHIQGGKQGVFVSIGNSVKFKKIVPLFNGNGFVVSDPANSDPNVLQVYDEVIENGDDLYDGEIIK